jgi:hypothetical protein
MAGWSRAIGAMRGERTAGLGPEGSAGTATGGREPTDPRPGDGAAGGGDAAGRGVLIPCARDVAPVPPSGSAA